LKQMHLYATMKYTYWTLQWHPMFILVSQKVRDSYPGAAFRYSVILLSDVANSTKPKWTLLNSFDYSKETRSGWLMNDLPFNFSVYPCLRYVEIKSNHSNSAAILFDSPRNAQDSFLPVPSDKFIFLVCDNDGIPFDNPIVMKIHPVNSDKENRTRIRDITVYKESILFIYMLDVEIDGRVDRVLRAGLRKIEMMSLELGPLEEIDVNLGQSGVEIASSNFTVEAKQFDSEVYFFFYCSTKNRIFICKLTHNDTYIGIKTCTPSIKADVQSVYRHTIFQVSTWDNNIRNKNIRVHLETKEMSTFRTLRSSTYFFSPITMILEPEAQWLYQAKLHYLRKVANGVSIGVLKERAFEYLDSKPKFLKILCSLLWRDQGSREIMLYSNDTTDKSSAILRLEGMIVDSIHNHLVIKKDSVKVEAFESSVVSISLKDIEVHGNNPTISPSKNVFVDSLTEDVHFEITPFPNSRIRKVVVEGDFVVASNDSREKYMWLYKCAADIDVRISINSELNPYFSCKLMKKLRVNGLVQLVEAVELADFLIVRFRSENSVVYYKIDKYEFSVLEINLKGYDPTWVSMVQRDPNTVILCHFKPSSPNPLMLFSLHGETLTMMTEPNLQSYADEKNKVFQAGGLFLDKPGTVCLYVALLYPHSLGYLKYVIHTHSNRRPVLIKSAFDLLEGRGVSQNGQLCFLPNKLFVLDKPPGKPMSATLIDLSNPHLFNVYPLKDFSMSTLLVQSVYCDARKNMIVVRGTPIFLLRPVTIYLGADFNDANRRLIRIVNDNVGPDCELNDMRKYYVEVCLTSKESNFPVTARFLRLPEQELKIVMRDGESELINIKAGNVDKSITLFKSPLKEPLRPDGYIREEFIQSISSHIKKENKESRVYSLDKDVLYHSGHYLGTRLYRMKKDELIPLTDGSVKIKDRMYSVLSLQRDDKFLNFTIQSIDGLPGFDRLVRKGQYLVGISVITRLQVLSTWISIFTFSANSSLQIGVIGRMQIFDICIDLDFDVYAANNDTNLLYLAMVCNNELKPAIVYTRFNLNKVDTENFTLSYPGIFRLDSKQSPCSEITTQVVKRSNGIHLGITTRHDPFTNLRLIYFFDNNTAKVTNILTLDKAYSYYLQQLTFNDLSFTLFLTRDGHLRYLKECWKDLNWPDEHSLPLEIEMRPDESITQMQCYNTDKDKTSCAVQFNNSYAYTFSVGVDNDGNIQLANKTKHFIPAGCSDVYFILIADFLIVDASLCLSNRARETAVILSSAETRVGSEITRKGILLYSQR
jgi:hypothetical protein